jgi:predicted SnoaL-like aldol condensation-catalyzing enzyme
LRDAVTVVSQPDLQRNKALIGTFIDVVWRGGHLADLATYWTEDCVNHADPSSVNRGLEALRRYHEHFGQAFAGFTIPTIAILQQIAEGDRVVTQIETRATQAASGKSVTLQTIRIDRLEQGKIAEHWSIADIAGLMEQLQT